MRSADLIRLLTLAAIWGASFLFMRVLVPAAGPLWTTELRVGIAALAMLAGMALARRAMQFRLHWRHYMIIGLFNSALPFALFAFAALTLPAGYSAIINATTPLWGALIGALMLGERLSARKIGGLALGIAGVAFLVRLGPVQFSAKVVLAVLACAGAAACYGLAGTYSKKQSIAIAPTTMATGSQVAAALLILPLLPLAPMRSALTPSLLLVACALALLCTAIAYVLYFRLIVDLGATRALTVTFLIPLFALLWGALFLHETITASMLAGCALVAVAMWLVVYPGKTQAPVAADGAGK
jgi:drug/metabolite transporter (DMT)-like permease